MLLSGSRLSPSTGAKAVDDQPVRAVESIGRARSATKSYRAAARADDRARTASNVRPLVRPPRGRVLRLRVHAKHDCARRASADASTYSWHDVRRIQPIPPAIDDEERLVDRVAGKDLAVGVHRRRAEHHHVANQRKKARPRRRVLESHEIRAGAAVRGARQIHAVFVDVVGALELIEDPREVVDLRRRPPQRLAPSRPETRRISSTAAGQAVDANPIDGRRPRPADTAVKIERAPDKDASSRRCRERRRRTDARGRRRCDDGRTAGPRGTSAS